MRKKISGIYKIWFHDEKKFYIGSAINLDYRKRTHLSNLRKNKHHNPILQNVFDKYGENNYHFKILLVCDPSMLLWFEQSCIDKFNPVYNICPTAGSHYGRKNSEEAKQKMRDAHLGLKCSEETRKLISENSRNISDETRKKLSESRKGHIVTEETRKKISNSNKGKKRSEEMIRKRKELNIRPSEESKKKNSDAHKGKKQSEETKLKRSISIKKWWDIRKGG